MPEQKRRAFSPLYFIRTKKHINQPNIKVLREQFIAESDQAEFPPLKYENTRIYPIAEADFPGVLSRMTATQAGEWARSKCHQQNWEVDLDNIECCLSNLEMDF